MLDVLIIRPGSTTFDDVGRIKGCLDIPLSEAGIAQAERISLALHQTKLDCLYVAPCMSAQMTAERIAERNFCKQRTVDWLINLNHGLWQGKLLAEVKRLQPTFYRQFQDNPLGVRPPGGETVNDVRTRFQPCLLKLLKKHAGGRIGLLVPEPLASVVHAFLSGRQLGDIWQLERDSGTFETIRIQSTDVQPVLQLA